MKNIVCTLYFQTENVFASFEMNFILRNTNISAVNIIMYIPTRNAFVNNTDTPDQRYIHELCQYEDRPCRRINKKEQIDIS